jgi:1-deoxy-D-xylulose-5-phosphate reductoisomerase
MKKKIVILGSTGSIGKSLLNIIEENKNEIKIELLTANKDYKSLFNQAKKFNVKNIIITDKKSFNKLKILNKDLNINIYNNFNSLNKIFKNKVDYVMSSIVGIHGLEPTIELIKFTKLIAIANKESIICGWNLINQELKKHRTKFIPVDSEHFSLWFGLKNLNIKNVQKFILTASGGPLYKTPVNNFKKIKISKALNHPNWKMGKKISIDSATMINKIYEVIEAKNIFDISYEKINILIHPKSYVHAILKFRNGLIKIIAHDTTMEIPIFNTLFFDTNKKIFSKELDLKVLNSLNFNKVDPKRYPMINLLKLLPKKLSLYETVIVSANDALVELYLKEKIKFTDINKKLFRFIKLKEFLKFKKKCPHNIKEIIDLNNYVRLLIIKKSV